MYFRTERAWGYSLHALSFFYARSRRFVKGALHAPDFLHHIKRIYVD